MRTKTWAFSAPIFCLLFAAHATGAECSFHIVKAQRPAEEKVAKVKLYVLDSQGDDATIIDIPTHEVIGRIKVGRHPHGIAVSAAQDRLFVSAEADNLLTIIDTRSDQVVKQIPVGPRPNEIAATPDGRLIYVPSLFTGTYEVVDVAQGKIVAKIQTGGLPHNVVCSADGAHMYLAPLGSPGRILIVETSTHQIVGEIPLADAPRPIVLSRDEKRLYIERDGLIGFELADVRARRVMSTVHLELSPQEQSVDSRAHGIGITPNEKELWVCNVNHSFVAVFDLAADPPQQIARIDTRSPPYWLTFSPDGKYGYVSCAESGEVQVIEVATRRELKRLVVGKSPKRLLAVTVARQ